MKIKKHEYRLIAVVELDGRILHLVKNRLYHSDLKTQVGNISIKLFRT